MEEFFQRRRCTFLFWKSISRSVQNLFKEKRRKTKEGEKQKMKRIILFLLTLAIMLSFTSCGSFSNSSNENSKAKEIQLTTDNYEKYLSILCDVRTPFGISSSDGALNVSNSNGGYGLPLDKGGSTSYVYHKLNLEINVAGTSFNFNYNDVEVKCKLIVKCKTYDSGGTRRLNEMDGFTGSKTIEKEFTIKCNVSGIGSSHFEYDLSNKYTHNDELEYEFEIISISGNVTPA